MLLERNELSLDFKVENEEEIGWIAVDQTAKCDADQSLCFISKVIKMDKASTCTGDAKCPHKGGNTHFWDAPENGEVTLPEYPFVDDYDFDMGSNPIIAGSKTTRAGNNGGWLRMQSAQGNSIKIIMDEDTALDAERDHIVETVGIIGFSRPAVILDKDDPDWNHCSKPGSSECPEVFKPLLNLEFCGQKELEGDCCTVPVFGEAAPPKGFLLFDDSCAVPGTLDDTIKSRSRGTCPGNNALTSYTIPKGCQVQFWNKCENGVGAGNRWTKSEEGFYDEWLEGEDNIAAMAEIICS